MVLVPCPGLLVRGSKRGLVRVGASIWISIVWIIWIYGLCELARLALVENDLESGFRNLPDFHPRQLQRRRLADSYSDVDIFGKSSVSDFFCVRKGGSW